jgi:hypothetical protein
VETGVQQIVTSKAIVHQMAYLVLQFHPVIGTIPDHAAVAFK